ncbi:unnamed protein product [Adineta steineri]|uniref:Uncharacterized protein n=1 Tax=Adineta steineri TaxID=433720 RepID=A0A815YQI8_9BILA|nr:unnamed protein product [Adineta steineri]CAF1572655.1 unnamed protein product [Adineta steineri]
MRIHFGLDINREMHAAGYAMALVMYIISHYDTLYNLKTSHESVLKLRMPNVTSNGTDLYCGIPYDDCRCSVVSVKYCLTDTQLKLSRIVPIVLFVVQIYLAHELFTLSGDHKHLLICALWITSMFVLIGIIALIYRSSCYHGHTLSILAGTGYLLFTSFVFALNSHKSASSVIQSNNFITNVQRYQMTDSEALV